MKHKNVGKDLIARASVPPASAKPHPCELKTSAPSILSAPAAQNLAFVTPEQLREAFLTEDPFLLVPLLAQSKLSSFVGNVDDPTTDQGTHLYVVRAMQALGAQDGQERFLAMQMVATHTLAMDSLAAAAHTEQTIAGRDQHLNRAVQLMRLYASQMEAWKQHRSKGEQRCTVEHVHVHSGAQAVVGTINDNRKNISDSPGFERTESNDGDK